MKIIAYLRYIFYVSMVVAVWTTQLSTVLIFSVVVGGIVSEYIVHLLDKHAIIEDKYHSLIAIGFFLTMCALTISQSPPEIASGSPDPGRCYQVIQRMREIAIIMNDYNSNHSHYPDGKDSEVYQVLGNTDSSYISGVFINVISDTNCYTILAVIPERFDFSKQRLGAGFTYCLLTSLMNCPVILSDAGLISAYAYCIRVSESEKRNWPSGYIDPTDISQ